MKAMEKKKCKIDCKRQKAAGNLRVAAETCSLTRRPPLRADCTGGNLKGTARVHLQVAARTFGRAQELQGRRHIFTIIIISECYNFGLDFRFGPFGPTESLHGFHCDDDDSQHVVAAHQVTLPPASPFLSS
jgi:hypothetical protein